MEKDDPNRYYFLLKKNNFAKRMNTCRIER